MLKYITLFALILLPLAQANAFQLRNLDSVPHTVQIMKGGTDIHELTIPAQSRRTIPSPNGWIRMSLDENAPFLRTRHTDIFAIWKGGKLHRQMRQKQRAH